MGEDRVGEKVGGDFDKLGIGKGSAEVVVGQVDGPEEGVTRHDRVKKKVNAWERSDVSGGGAGRLEAVTAGGTANATVHAGGGAAERAGEEEGGDILPVPVRSAQRISMVYHKHTASHNANSHTATTYKINSTFAFLPKKHIYVTTGLVRCMANRRAKLDRQEKQGSHSIENEI